MSNIVVRVDASLWIGSGHVMRCLTLADELESAGFHIKFACMPQKGDLCSYIEERGFEVIFLTPPKDEVVPRDSSDYEAWLQRTVGEDANELVEYLDGVDWVICDHYALGYEWQHIIKRHSEVKILAIDDLVRKHDADIVVDQTLSRLPSEYSSSGVVLTGVDFAILSSQFRSLRREATRRSPNLEHPKMLISFGGIDLPNATLSVLNSIELAGLTNDITVLMNRRSPHFSVVSDWCNSRSHVEHIEFTNQMAELMLSHDIAIGAPGSTSWERACLGLPSIVIPIADNQKNICSQLVIQGLSYKVDLENISEQLMNAYNKTCINWESIFMNNLKVCDGKGVLRIVSKIRELDNENNNSMY